MEMESMSSESLTNKLLALAQKIANEELPSFNLTREEIAGAVAIAQEAAERKDDPYTIEEVSQPNAELRNFIEECLKKRIAQRDQPGVRLVIDNKSDTVLGRAESPREERKIVEDERQAA